MFYPVLRPQVTDLLPFQEKKLCTLINANKKSSHPHELYSEREKVIQFYETKPKDEFEFYGQGWESKGYQTYLGPIGGKHEALKQYRFCICYENCCEIKGYITEKIFDCFAAGCVPIYWGASNVMDYIPADCFIDRRQFQNDEEVYQLIKSMSPEIYEGYQRAITKFLLSEEAQLFSQERFVALFVEAVSQ
jgi:hypothetical protein